MRGERACQANWRLRKLMAGDTGRRMYEATLVARLSTVATTPYCLLPIAHCLTFNAGCHSAAFSFTLAIASSTEGRSMEKTVSGVTTA